MDAAFGRGELTPVKDAEAPQGADAVGGPLIYINAPAIRCAMVAFPEWKPT